jgi:hypothetical protein
LDKTSSTRPAGKVARLLLPFFVILAMVVCTSLVCQEQRLAPTAKTKYATQITAGGARLNGDLITLGTASQVSLYFDWGPKSASYTSRATVPARTTPGLFYFDISGLEPDTSYYFRAVAVGDGTYYGAEKSFRTSSLP